MESVLFDAADTCVPDENACLFVLLELVADYAHIVVAQQ